MKNYFLVEPTQPEPSRALAPVVTVLRLGITTIITIVALVIFGPFWIVEAGRRRFGKPY